MSHVLVVCARRYNGHELWVALGTLTNRGHTFELISTSHIIEDEVTHGRQKIKTLVGEVDLEDIGPDRKYQGFMIVSGNMKDTESYWSNDVVLSYISTANEAGLPIAAICCSVPSIRQAADGKKVSFYPLFRSRDLLRSHGAILQNVAMTRDQNLVTAEHQMASQVWADEFCNLLEGKPQEHFFVPSPVVPKGKERLHKPKALQAMLDRSKEPQSDDLTGDSDETSIPSNSSEAQHRGSTPPVSDTR